MDLRPLNPYYRQNGSALAVNGDARRKSKKAYSYPYIWQEPVTDRNQTDVDHAKKLLAISWREMDDGTKKEFLSGLKGCLNRSDLNRIENNIRIMLDVLEINAASGVGSVPEIPDESYFAQLRDNVEAIRSAYTIHADTPLTPEVPLNTWQKINAAEKILADVYEVVSAQFNYYAGSELYAGDAVGLLL